MSTRLFAVAAAALLAVSGCAAPTPPAPVQVDLLNEGIAKTCTFTPVQPKPGETVDATITMTNDGWCAYRATESAGKAYLLGLVRQRPAHGELLIRKWNEETRVEFYPASGYVGTDSFTVALRPTTGGADAIVHVTATVTKGDGTTVAPPSEETPASEPARTTTRRKPAARH